MRRSGLLLGGLLALAVPALAREWYEAYQEGSRALARGQHQQALFLFEEAIQQRARPGVNLRTYGTNVERTYYPYLRLAEAHLGLGSLEGARAALQRSESIGVEPADERARLRARLEQLSERQRPQPPPTTAAAPTTTLAPTPAATPPPSTLPAPSATPSALAPTVTVMTPPPRRPAPADSLQTKASPALLEVISQPAGALVSLDDEPLGPTNPTSGRLVKRDVAPGRHHVRIALEGYQELSQDVELVSGGTTTLHAPLARKTEAPAPQLRPGLGAALAAAAIAVAVAAVLALWLRSRRRATPALDESTASRRFALKPSSGATPARLEAATPTPEGALPARFGEFLLLERIGRGGMASVFKAERRGELSALKRPRGSVIDDPLFLERFLREAEIGRTLHHPNIIRIFERGDADGLPFFTMELIEGETLSARLKREGALLPIEAARAVLQIAEALDYAHSKGVVHRDLKPSNTMVDRAGNLKVMDFGIARAQRFEGMTVTGSFLGSPDYAAPESIEGRSVDARSDLYSLGVVLFELLTGRRPFEGETSFAVLQKHCAEPAPPPSRFAAGIPPELDAITLKLLAKSPDARFASAEQLLLALRAWIDQQR